MLEWSALMCIRYTFCTNWSNDSPYSKRRKVSLHCTLTCDNNYAVYFQHDHSPHRTTPRSQYLTMDVHCAQAALGAHGRRDLRRAGSLAAAELEQDERPAGRSPLGGDIRDGVGLSPVLRRLGRCNCSSSSSTMASPVFRGR